MTIYAIHATIGTSAENGYRGARTVPTFYLDSRVQGILDREHAVKVAAGIIDPIGLRAGALNIGAYEVDPAREDDALEAHEGRVQMTLVYRAGGHDWHSALDALQEHMCMTEEQARGALVLATRNLSGRCVADTECGILTVEWDAERDRYALECIARPGQAEGLPITAWSTADAAAAGYVPEYAPQS